MPQPVILASVRTPIGKFLGSLQSKTAPQLGAIVIREVIQRAHLSVQDIAEVIMGNVLLAGVGQNPARQSALGAGLPTSINAFQVGKVCGSGLKAVVLAAQAIKAGDAELIIAGGQESMSNAPLLKSKLRSGRTLSDEEFTDSMVRDGLWDCYNDLHMGSLVENVIKKLNITRAEQDQFALESNQRAVLASSDGTFQREIIPVDIDGQKIAQDESPRPDSTLAKLATLKPVFSGCDTVTAGNSSKLNDGAAALAVASRDYADKHSLSYDFIIDAYTSFHTDPKFYGLAPVGAIRKICQTLDIQVSDFDLIEINEAFAAQALGVVKELNINPQKLNIHGGAVALGHPIGASGARILVTLLHAMQEKNAERGLAAICLGGGGAVALAVSRIT